VKDVDTPVPVLFLHGHWVHASGLDPWVERFRDAGYEPAAPGWPGEPDTVAEARVNLSSGAGKGIKAIADHYAGALSRLKDKPILVGQGVGALVAQQLLGQGRARAAVAFEGVRPTAALPNRQGVTTLTKEQWRRGFAPTLSTVDADELHDRLAVPAPTRVGIDVMLRHRTRVNFAYATRGPLLLVGPKAVRQLKRYSGSTGYIETKVFAGRGPSLLYDAGWCEVADFTLGWLKEHA
jgi:hypothetical protein